MKELLPKNQTQAQKIAFLDGRPKRTQNISKDDILNLIISLELYEDVLDLVGDRHLFR